jgi:4-hydroxy-3-polyprenylbenzoate decarboxylase
MGAQLSPDGAAPRRLIVGMTGGTGAVFGVRLLEALRRNPIETHLVMCDCSRATILAETGLEPDQVRKLADRVYAQGNQAARISSGSFLTEGMVIAPCSMKSLAAIANGLATNLVHRAADVTMKEGRKLVLLARDAPLSPIQMENMARLAGVPGAVVLPPMAGSPDDGIEAMVDRTVGVLLDQFGIQHDPS